MIKRILLASGAAIATVAFTAGVAGAASITNTGPKSVNVVAKVNISTCTSVNSNNTGINTVTVQGAKTGDAKSSGNTKGGSATSGNATNLNGTTLTLNTTNNGACGNGGGVTVGDVTTGGGASIDTTGPHSVNVIGSLNFSSVTSVNQNNTWVGTTTLQGAQSGNATVQGNTGGGSATSGPASNTNSTTITLTASNN